MFWFKKKQKQNDEDNYAKPVFLKTASDNYEFSVIKAVLEDNKIPYITQDHGGASYLKLRTGSLLENIDFYVSNAAYTKANELVNEVLKSDESVEEVD